MAREPKVGRRSYVSFDRPCADRDHLWNGSVTQLPVWVDGKQILPAQRVRRCTRCGAIDPFDELGRSR